MVKLVLITLAVMAFVGVAMAKCNHPDDPDRSCSADNHCCGPAVCRPSEPNFSGQCGLACCWPSGSISPDPCYCCNQQDSSEIDDCGYYACADICNW